MMLYKYKQNAMICKSLKTYLTEYNADTYQMLKLVFTMVVLNCLQHIEKSCDKDNKKLEKLCKARKTHGRTSYS